MTLSSEGIFIFDGTNPLPWICRLAISLRVTGTVDEFFGQTQISATNITVIASDQVVPDAVEVTFPTANVSWTMAAATLSLRISKPTKGMRVNIAQDLTVSELFNLDRFGQYNVTSDGRVVQFTQNNDPDAAGYAEHSARHCSPDVGVGRRSYGTKPRPIAGDRWQRWYPDSQR